ncbi:copper resistance CopC family protein [Colwellia sp. 12G3]|uniref:copper resistance CopC family protein n=1 Tax=Colwellia sp. 12G3 TaxID=2058299 RepID=UPI000C322EF5|nr:copper resistance CopC family protein [Colwellia sp. 12G3]PKI14917.1 copper resistance protein CopC [Colwellia sp. 12G3]
MKKIIKLLIILSFTVSSLAFAHVGLNISIPKDNAMLMQSPESLVLTFTKEVRVVKVILKDSKDNEVDFGFKLNKDSAAEFSWALPKLIPSNYRVEWTIMGADGHKMKGKFGFMVH